MRIWIAAAILAAACASADPAPQAQHSAAAQPAAQAGQPNYEDARSGASDEDIRVARRAYRNACTQGGGSADYCECMTASMAQALAPAELAIATAQLSGSSQAASSPARVGDARARSEAACVQYRRS